MKRTRRTPACIALVLGFLTLGPAETVLGETDPAGASLPFGTQPAMYLAHRWLSQSRCRGLFAEFRDASGRTLQEVLDARGETPQSHMSRIAFVPGASEGRCSEESVLATANPGHDVVRVCGRKFASLARRNPPAVAVVFLHEELHSLGLGEDPPTSREISQRIEASCR